MKEDFEKYARPSIHDFLSFARAGKLDQVQALLDRGIAVDAKDVAGLTALMHAAAKGRNDVVALLLTHGANIDERSKNGGTALTSAAWAGQVDTVRLLLDQGADMNIKTQGWTALMCAARRHGGGGEHEKTVALLAARGANVNETSDGWTALMHTAVHGDKEMAGLLLGKCADPTMRNNDGDTTRALAIKYGHADFLNVFKDVSATVFNGPKPRP